MTNLFDFQDKVALVTGGGSGIGEACCHLLAAQSACTVVADVNLESAVRVVSEIEAAGGRAAAARVDVTDPESVAEMVNLTRDRFGGLDLAVNSAAIVGTPGAVGDHSLDNWKQVLDVDLNGVFHCLRSQIPALLERGGGSIVNMASAAGAVAMPNSCAYVAAKHGVVGLTKSAAIDYARNGIRVNCVGPSFVDGPMLRAALGETMIKAMASFIPMRRLANLGEVAAVVLFLLSDAASFITGSYYPVDGGYLSQ